MLGSKSRQTLHPHQQPSHFHSEQKHQENWFCSYLLVPIELAYAPLQLRSILADIVRRRTHHSLYYPSMSQSLNLRPHKIHRTVSTTPRIGNPFNVFKLFLLTNSVHRYIVAGWDSMRPTRNPTRPIGAIKRHAHIESRRSPFPIPINKPSNVRASRHIPGTPSATDNILIGGTERHCVLYGALSTRYDSGCACLVPPDPGLARWRLITW